MKNSEEVPVSNTDTKAIARDRVEKALAHIEDAQRSLAAACQLLCPVAGFVIEWERTGKLYDYVKHLWHQIAPRAQASDYDLDESAKRCVAEGRSV